MTENTPGRRILIITPAKDEGEYIEKTLQSLIAQTHRPALWIIVNDGSDDDTGETAERYAAEHDWIQVVHGEKGRPRAVGPGVIDAFYFGLGHANMADFDYVTKMDADIELQPRYFEILMERFEENPRLATASGKAWVPVEDGTLAYERTGDDFSHGVTKLFRREAFEEIGGFVREVMWDGIDCHRCRMLGWDAVSYHDEELRIVHLRLMGSSFKSVYHGRMRWGRGQYFMGTHPLYILAVSAYRMLERPWILGGICILLGYIKTALGGMKRYDDPEFRSYLRQWQMLELKRRFLGGRGKNPVKGRSAEERLEVDPHRIISSLQPQAPAESRDEETVGAK